MIFCQFYDKNAFFQILPDPNASLNFLTILIILTMSQFKVNVNPKQSPIDLLPSITAHDPALETVQFK